MAELHASVRPGLRDASQGGGGAPSLREVFVVAGDLRDGGDDAGDPDPVGTHGDGDEFAVAVQDLQAQRLGVLLDKSTVCGDDSWCWAGGAAVGGALIGTEVRMV